MDISPEAASRFDRARQLPAGEPAESLLKSGDGNEAPLQTAETVVTPCGERDDHRVTPASFPVEQAGGMIGRYKLLESLGEGGMGAVWVAEQREPIVRRVALKIIKLGMDTKEVVARFEQERQALALMDHPGIARVFDAGSTETGRPFFVMELVRGVTLTRYCDDRKLGVKERLAIFSRICQAVQHAHQKGIIHRDLKPSNVLVTAEADGEPLPKIIDFGIAKATGSALSDSTLFTQITQIVGTPAYMSPEQAGMGPGDIDTRSDIYALGVLLYELLTGRPPFDSKELISAGLEEMRRVIREKEPPRPSTRISSLSEKELTGLAEHHSTSAPRIIAAVKGDLDWIAMKALEKDRNRRYESANGLAADVQRHLDNQPVFARPPGAGYLLSRFVRRHKFGFAAGAALVITLIGGVTTTTWGLWRAEAARKDARDEAARAIAANAENRSNLQRASMADFASASKMCIESFETEQKGGDAIGFAGKLRCREAIALLTRSLVRDPQNHRAALLLYDTLRCRPALKRDCPLMILPHDGPAINARFSQDGARIVTVEGTNSIRVWDAVTGRLMGEPLRHDDRVNRVELSPDLTRALTVSSDHTMQIRDLATGKNTGESMRHGDEINSVEFSPDGTLIVTASDDHTARVWEAATGRAQISPLQHDDKVPSARFSPDGTRIVTACGSSKTARVWEAQSGKPVGELMRHDSILDSARFSPDGRMVVTVSDWKFQFWDATGHSFADAGKLLTGEPVLDVCFSPDGSKIATSGIAGRFRDVAAGGFIGKPMADIEVYPEFSQDGAMVVARDGNGDVRLWNAETGEGPGERMHHDGVNSAAFSPDGTRILTAGNGGVCVWEVNAGLIAGEPLRMNGLKEATFDPAGSVIITSSPQVAQRRDISTGKVLGGPIRRDGMDFEFSPDYGKFLTVSDGSIQVFDAVTGQAIRGPIGISPSQEVNFTPDGTKVIVRGPDDVLSIWSVRTGERLGEPMHGGSLSGIDFSPDGTRILTRELDSVQIWGADTGKPAGKALPGNTIWQSGFSPDSGTVWIADDNGVQTWDVAAGRRLAILRHDGGGAVHGARYCSDGGKIVTWADKKVQIWNAATGKATGEPLTLTDTVNKADFSLDGKWLLTVDLSYVRVWDVAAGKPICPPMGGKRLTPTARFSQDGARVAVFCSRSGADEAWLCEPDCGQTICSPPGRVMELSMSPDGSRVVTITTGEDARIWYLRTGEDSRAIGQITPNVIKWAENLSGMRFGDDGELQLIPEAERMAALEAPGLPAGPWAELARWINTPAPARALDAKSKNSLRQIAERERDFDGSGSLESLKSALRHDPSLPLARMFLAAAMEQEVNQNEKDDKPTAGVAQRAAFLRRYELDSLARKEGWMNNGELAALWLRAAQHLLSLSPDAKIGIGTRTTSAKEEALKAAQKAVDLSPEVSVAQELLKKVKAAQK